MLELILIAVVCILTWLVLRGGWQQKLAVLDLRPKGEALLLGIASVALAVYFIGPYGGVALIISVMVHEFGHVAAFRVAGHPDARFRLIPMFGGVAISNKAPKSQLHQFYISIMGPGICLALMLVSFVMDHALEGIWPNASYFFWRLATITAALNFFNMLPLWPLDGGKIVHILTHAISPTLAHFTILAMSAALVGLALLWQSVFLFIFAAISAQSAFSASHGGRMGHSLKPGQAITAFFAYITMLAAFGMGGIDMIIRMFF
ncbi:MAG: site-2 protease family protein [Paracoccaceae bacterium]